MNGEFAQAIALVAWGNQALASSSPPATDLAAENSTFRYVGALTFTTSRSGAEIDVAATPEDWFAWLAGRGVRRLRLATRTPAEEGFPARITAALARSGQWFIVEDPGADKAGYWFPLWTVVDRASPTPWHVRYISPRGRQPRRHSPRTVDEARAVLISALEVASEVANALETPLWLESFREAMDQLESTAPRARFHDDALPPTGYELRARQLFAAAVGAWVFGGMGSWNDVRIPDGLQRRYDAASEALYTAVLQSFPAVLDSAQISS